MNRNDRAVTGFAMLGHALFHTYELSIPVFVVVWLDAFAVSPATLGVIVGVGYALVGLGALPSGALSDAYGSKALVLASILGMGGGFLLLGLASDAAALAAALLLWGAAAGLYHPAGLSLLSRAAERRGTAFAYHGAAGNVGTALGPLATAVLLVAFDWRTVAGLFVLPALLGAVAAFRLDFDERATVEVDGDGREPPVDGCGRLSELVAGSRALFTGGFVVAFAVAMTYGVYYRGLFTFLPEVLGGLPPFRPTTLFGATLRPGQYVYASLLLLGGVGQYVGGRLTDRVRAERALVGTFVLLCAASLAFVPAADAGLAPLLVVCGLLSVLVYAGAPIYQAIIANHAAADVHGLSFGYTYLGTFGIGAVGATLAGVVLTYGGRAVLFTVLASVAAVAGLLGLRLAARA